MKKIVITLIISLSFLSSKISIAAVNCANAVRCHDKNSDTFRLVGHGEKTKAVPGHASSQDAAHEAHCECA